MAATQWERQKKYLQNKTTYHVMIPKEEAGEIKAFLENKGYSSVNDYFNIVLKLDRLMDFIPTKEKALNALNRGAS